MFEYPIKHSYISSNACYETSQFTFFFFLKVLAFEAGRKHKIRVNTISAGTTINLR